MIIAGRILFLWLWLIWAASAGADPSPEQTLEKFLATADTLRADFTQQTLDESATVTQENRGKFYLKRPGRFRWVYESPFRQEIVADGRKVWFYDPDLEQVTVRTIDAALGSAPALLLSGQIRLSQRFVVKGQGMKGRHGWLVLEPKDEDDVFRHLRVEMEEGRLKSMELADNFGQLTRIRFSHLEINPPLDDQLFTFVPPAGVDVFEGG